MELNEIIENRIAKLKSLREKGIDPFGAKFEFDTNIAGILSDFQENKAVIATGRIMARRSHGKTAFLDIRDQTDKMQVYIKENLLSKENCQLYEELDVGDIIGVKGELFKTRTEEITIKANELVLLSKSLRPLPEKWHGLKDVETRYRQRYVDMIANKEVKAIFELRSKIISFIRSFFNSKGYLEVETPILHNIPGGAAGKPFKSFHNEFDMDVYLRIAPELYLKRLLVGGFEKVYEINRSFRNEGVSTRHNPEFTMLESYCAYADYEDMMKLTEELISSAAKEILGSFKVEHQGGIIDFTPPWDRIPFAKLMKDTYDISPEEDLNSWIAKLSAKGIEVKGKNISRSFITNFVADKLVPESSQNRPVFVVDLFTSLCPLAKRKKEDPNLSERFELFIAGIEVANAYSELNDPIEQRKRFQDAIKEDDKEIKTIDEDYLRALEYGMPPAGGLGIGIDRLIMLLANQPSIRDVILFPLLRAEGK